MIDVALLTDLWPSRDEIGGPFVQESVRAAGDGARFAVLVPRVVGLRLHQKIWGNGIQGWQRGWEAPPPGSALVPYPFMRLPRIGEAATRAAGARLALLRAGERPQLVHAHFLYQVGQAGLRLAHRLGVPSVITVHGTDARWLFEGGVQERHRRWMLETAERADRLLVVTAAMREAFLQRGVERVDVLPMGVDEQLFRTRDRAAVRAELGLDERVPIVLFVGRPTAEKGLPVLERALARLEGVRAYAAGPPPPEGRVEGLGVLAPAALARWLAAADVLCLPSFAEGMPVAVSEALATGTPIVATTVGGMPEQVGEVSGLLVEPGDDHALADALHLALNRAWDSQAIRESSRRFWWSTLGPRLVAVYRDLTQ